jgi:outer membrane protein TolC
MKRKILFFNMVLLVLVMPADLYAREKREMSIDQVMRLAELNSPKLSASRFREIAAERSVDVARSNYFPTVNAEAIDSTGFPASSAGVGVTGLMGSPYRSGYSVGLVAEQTIYDFGRTYYDVEASKNATEYSKQNTRVNIYEVKQLALQAFYDCAFYKTQRDIWGHLSDESAIITHEAQKFVNTGQRSIVDRYLSKAQTEEARTAQAFFATRLDESIHVLAAIMNISDHAFSCPSLPSRLTSALNPNSGIESSPLLTRAVANSRVAEARLKQQQSGFYPKIVAVASVGAMADARLEPKKNYAAGLGIVLPLLDLHTSGEIHRAQAVASASEKELEAQRQYVTIMNAKYDEDIRASTVRLQHLDEEFAIAKKAFDTAKKRYFALEGDLIDLREAFRNLARVETTIEDTRTHLLQASGAKALLNGGGG